MKKVKGIGLNIMSVAANKFLNRNGTKALKLATQNFARMTSTDAPCSSKQPEQSKPKAEPGASPPTPTSTCPKPPPCPSMPQCPPTICPPFVDSNDPCNYCPPPCPDPELPDMTRIKKLQCFFQEDNGIPIYLKKGNVDALLYQFHNVLLTFSLIYSFYVYYLLSGK